MDVMSHSRLSQDVLGNERIQKGAFKLKLDSRFFIHL